MKFYITILLFVYLFFISSESSKAQPKCHIEHYGLLEGLPQRVVMSINQDKEGFMWFATWDGLCKFDGYNFTKHTTKENDSIFMRTNRIDKIYEDVRGYIWVYAYNKETFRFNPKTEKYITAFSRVNGKPFIASDILPMPSGKVWLISENMGAICVPDSTNNYTLFSLDDNRTKSDCIYSVYEDDSYNSWILTANGMVQVTPENKSKFHFTNITHTDGNINSHFYTAFETDSEIWFGTNFGRIWSYNKRRELFTPIELGIKSNIVSIKKISEDYIVILTSNDGFIIYNQRKATFKNINRSTNKELPTNAMISAFIDKSRNIWIEMEYSGIVKYDFEKDKVKYFGIDKLKMKNDPFGPRLFILEDRENHLWVHLKGGGFSYYDKRTDSLLPFFNDPKSPNWKFSDELHDMFIDKQNNLWLSTRSQGLEKVVFDSEFFKLNDLKYKVNNPDLTKVEVRAVWKDKDDNVWLGNREGQILVYDPNKNFRGYLCTDGSISETGTPVNALAYAFETDKHGNIWLGTKGSGIYLLKPQGQRFNITHYESNPSDINSLSNNLIYTIHKDNKGRIWVGTYGGGLNLYDEKNKRFINHRNGLNGYPIDMGYGIRMIKSHNDKIYVGTTLGLIAFSSDFDNVNSVDYIVYSKNYKEKNRLKSNDIFNFYTTQNNDFYIATFGGGLAKVISFDYQGFPLDFKTYNTGNGLHTDIVFSMIEDHDNNLWINGEGSLSKFNPATESFEVFNDVSQILRNQYFSEASPILTRQNEIIFGCTKGIISFYPDRISKNEYKPHLAFIRLKVPNKKAIEGNSIDDIKCIELNYDENIFNVEFAALDFTNPFSVSYAYKLEGADRDWIYCQNQRIVNYTKLPPGDYVFKVKSTNSNGIWVDNERALHIVIKPAIWQTSWAYVLYTIVIFLILYAILRSVFVFYRLKDNIALEQEQTEMRSRFFTDISHEIRTPLTMIVSPIEDVLDNEKTHPDIKPQLQLILRNANRMLKMVNQILDFRKVQKQKLQVREVIIGEYVENLCRESFRIIENQKIILKINNQIGLDKIWVDAESIEKLLYNLISNSVKHSNNTSERKIEVNIYPKDKNVLLQIKDDGEGMSKEVLSKLFTRFASFSKDKSKPSTGIGLSIVKEIADKHHAKILVDSEVDKGTSFTIIFKTGFNHFEEDVNVDIIKSEDIPVDKIGVTNPIPDVEDANGDDVLNTINNKLSILIVEDDDELRSFIKSILKPHYHIYEAENGVKGYSCAMKHMPDFILSDIMMPEMDGTELLTKIRENNQTSHIPFILLTAKTSADDELMGITLGADDYITKPFNVKLLKAKIQTIIQQRKKTSDRYMIGEEKSGVVATNDQTKPEYRMTLHDELFLKNLKNSIEENLDNSSLAIDDLVDKTYLSRRVFFNKVKSLTGLSPIEFVREYRIKRSTDFLKEPQYRIKEITYMIGFSDFRYYSKCFKNIYNMTPTEYRNNLGK